MVDRLPTMIPPLVTYDKFADALDAKYRQHVYGLIWKLSVTN